MMAILSTNAMLAFGWPGGAEWIVLLVIGLLIFGRRLPEVGRSLGKGIVEFKRGIKGIEDEIDEESSHDGKQLPKNEYRNLAEQAEGEGAGQSAQPAEQQEAVNKQSAST